MAKYEDIKNDMDLNQDGKVDEFEQAIYERKAVNRRKMAWVSLAAMIGTALVLMSPLVPESRLEKLENLLDFYWIALGTITGAYVGISTWMTKK